MKSAVRSRKAGFGLPLDTPPMEVTVVETPAHLRRKKRPDLGIALISLP
jgi:hypothetical protein